MTTITIIYSLIATIIITLFCILNIYVSHSNISNYFIALDYSKKNPEYSYRLNDNLFDFIYGLLFTILNSIIIILLWVLLYLHFIYQTYYINLLYLFVAIITSTIICIYIIFLSYKSIYLYNTIKNPKFAQGVVTKVICDADNKKTCMTEIEYTINDVKYTKSTGLHKYKENDKITMIYNIQHPDWASIYEEQFGNYSWIFLFISVIVLILLWIFFIYDIYNLK